MADLIVLQSLSAPPDVYVRWKDMGDGTYALVMATPASDPETGAQVSIDYEHEEVHEGEMFSISHYFSAVANSGHADILLIAPVTPFHFKCAASAGGESIFRIYEAPAVSNNGTTLPIVNMHRYSDKKAPHPMAAYYTPTVTNTGALLVEELVPGGAVGRAVGAAARTTTEWIARRGGHYLVRLTNVSGQARNLSQQIQGYLFEGEDDD